MDPPDPFALRPLARDAFASWQCQQFYARQEINGYCLTVPGGEMGTRQCQQFYARLISARPDKSVTNKSISAYSASPSISATQARLKTEVSLRQSGSTFIVPVAINNAIQLAFMIDSGASDVSIPANVVITLIKAGTISATDFLEKRLYGLADGSTASSQTFRIKSLAVGKRMLENVIGSIAPSLLLGQGFLSRFRSWSIDNQREVLVLE